MPNSVHQISPLLCLAPLSPLWENRISVSKVQTERCRQASGILHGKSYVSRPPCGVGCHKRLKDVLSAYEQQFGTVLVLNRLRETRARKHPGKLSFDRHYLLPSLQFPEI